jgi:hypothetical protein
MPISIPDDDGNIAPEFEQRLAPAPAQLSAPRLAYDFAYLMPDGAGIRETSYYTGIQQRLMHPEYALTDLPPAAEENNAVGMWQLGAGAVFFVFTANAVARKRRQFRKKYRLVLGTKAEYQRAAA